MKHNYTSTLRRALSAVVLLLCVSTLSWAYDFEAGGIYYNINDDGTSVTVTSVPSNTPVYSGDIVILSTVVHEDKTYRVTGIGDWAFGGCSSLTSIDLPEGLTSIGDVAFGSCTSLTSIDIPESVTSIGVSAFSGCSYLTSISIPEGLTSIGQSAFYNCFSLTSIDIPSSVTSIEGGVFEGCSSLTSITVSADNPVYDSREGCNAIIETEANTLLRGCQNTIIPSGVMSIGYRAFSDCTSLSSIDIPLSVTRIDGSAFSGCTSLTSIDIPSSVTSIGGGAFSDCSSLVSIYIPSSVTSIEHNPFWNCSSLAWVTVSDGNPVYDSRQGCNAIIETKTNALTTGCQNTMVPATVTSIGGAAFAGCTILTSIYIPESVKSIGNNAFYGCASLTSISIPSSVAYIDVGAFSDCSSLTSIDLPFGLTSIESNTFIGCSSLTSINIPEGVTRIGDRAFMGCSSLTSIDIPSSVTSIGGDRAFSYCTSLTSMTVSENNPVYDSRKRCNAIIETKTNTLVAGCKSTVIPSSVANIGDHAFAGCSSLTSIVIPSGVTGIGDWAFDGCSSLTTIDIPGGVTRIENCAFYECSSLTNVICRAEKVPYVSYTFTSTPTDKATLYVPFASIEAYKATAPWSSFGTILPLEDYETGIDTPSALQPDDASATAPYYSLGGQRVNAPVRGHIYIRSGRKVIY